MAKLQPPREGQILKTTGIEVPYSFWPARLGKRWKLQRRLYVKDPWATLFEAVYRARIPKSRVDEALSYLDQAEHYFNAGTQVGGRISVKPVLLYYSVLNLAKGLLAARNTGLNLSGARHGLTADHSHLRATLGDVIRVSGSTKYVNVFPEAMRLLTGGVPNFGNLEVRHLLPQILPAHRLWSYASGRREQFVNVEIVAKHNETARQAWLSLAIEKGELDYLGQSVKGLIKSARLPGAWKQVKSASGSHVLIQQVTASKYLHRPIDCVQKLFDAPRPALWSAVTSVYPHRKYYLNVDSGLGSRRLPQWASMYILFFYLSDLTRYRPLHFDRFLESKYGPQVESILHECPSQFLYLMASELIQREVAPAALA